MDRCPLSWVPGQVRWVGYRREGGRRQQKSLFRCVEKKRRAKHDLISPGRTGWDLAPASPLRKTGCCGFKGPFPSATLDKILTKLSEKIVGQGAGESNAFP